jgi:hypothetical protein
MIRILACLIRPSCPRKKRSPPEGAKAGVTAQLEQDIKDYGRL